MHSLLQNAARLIDATIFCSMFLRRQNARTVSLSNAKFVNTGTIQCEASSNKSDFMRFRKG
jgi:hypothetical protein